MLFPRSALDRIAAGTVDLAFRRWRSPRVRPGTGLRTAVGVVVVDSVERVAARSLTASDARRAGFETLAALREANRSRDGRALYRIELHHGGADPRIELRRRAELGPDELGELERRLAGFDARSPEGPWTGSLLSTIAGREGVRAADLAADRGEQTLSFKRRVRRLKELGLTESLETGYRISPRGKAVLEHLRRGAR